MFVGDTRLLLFWTLTLFCQVKFCRLAYLVHKRKAVSPVSLCRLTCKIWGPLTAEQCHHIAAACGVSCPVPRLLYMGEWVVGAFINLIGSLAINFGTNLLKLGHNEVATSFLLVGTVCDILLFMLPSYLW